MKFNMRPSRVLRQLRAGNIVHSFKLNFSDVRVTQMACSFGFDCIWTCMEHVPNDLQVIEMQVLATKAYDVDLMCRVSRGGYSDYIRPLELDSTGIMVPHIMSAADAKNVVRMTRFQPVGRRAVDGGNADGGFCNVEFTEYLRQANKERFVVLQIEDPEPMAELDAIADVPGYDILLFGPGDFSHGIGKPGQMNDPEVMKAREKIAKAAIKYGKFPGTVGSPGNRQSLIDIGYKFINVGADVSAMAKYCQDVAKGCGIETINELPGQYGEKSK